MQNKKNTKALIHIFIRFLSTNRCDNLDCIDLDYFNVTGPEKLFSNCPVLRNVKLFWHDVDMASYLNISNQLLEPLDNVSYLAAKDSGAKSVSQKRSQCQKISECNMIDKALSLYGKACTVELECFDGQATNPMATRTYFDNEWKKCKIERSKYQKQELELTIWNHYHIFVIAGNCYQMYFTYYDYINTISHCFVINIDTT